MAKDSTGPASRWPSPIMDLCDLASFLRMNAIRHRQSRRIAAAAGIQFLPARELRQHKEADTLVAFGSGGSINDITESEWDWIVRQDTIGLNFWPLHPFVPKMLMFELPHLDNRKTEMVQVFADRAADYRNCLLLTHTLGEHGISTLRQLSSLFPNIIVTHFHKVSDRLVPMDRFARRLKIFAHLYRLRLVRQPSEVGGSLYRLIALAHFLGYKRIVLVGFDLSGTRYFWEHTSDVTTGQSGDVHRTMLVNEKFKLSGLDAVKYAATHFFEPDGFEIRVLNRSSALHPRFAHWNVAKDANAA